MRNIQIFSIVVGLMMYVAGACILEAPTLNNLFWESFCDILGSLDVLYGSYIMFHSLHWLQKWGQEKKLEPKN